MSAKLIKVIFTNLKGHGRGTMADPYRQVTQYWSEDGTLLATVDPYDHLEHYESCADIVDEMRCQYHKGGEDAKVDAAREIAKAIREAA